MSEEKPTPPPAPNYPGHGRTPPPRRNPEPTRGKYEYSALENGPGVSAVLNALLKSPGKLVHEAHQQKWKSLLGALVLIAAVSLAIYGLVAGSFSGGWQILIGSVKIVLVGFLSALICFPSLYIFMALSGIDARLSSTIGAILAMLALVGLLLVGLAPVAWVFSQSTESVAFMGILHLFFYTIAIFFGIRSLWAEVEYHPDPDKGHMRVWVVIFVVVSLQMLTVFRPILTPSEHFLPREKKFFLQHWTEGMADPVFSEESRSSGNERRQGPR